MTNICKIRVLLAGLMLQLCLPAHSAEPPPISTYGELPAIEFAALSPTGQNIAVIGRIGGIRQLLFLNSNMELFNRVGVEDLKLRALEWIGDEAVLVTYSETEELSREFVADKYEAIYALIVPAKPGEQAKTLFADNNEIVNSIFGRYGIRKVDGEWIGYFGAIRLIGFGSLRELDTTSPSLFEVKLLENDPDLIADPPRRNFWRDWLIDETGGIAATFEMNLNNGRWRIDNERGKTLARGENKAGRAGLVSLGKDGQTVIYSIEQEAGGELIWFEVALSGETEPAQIFGGQGIERIYVDPLSGRLIGYYRTGELAGRQFFDPDLQQASDKISRAFSTLNLSLVDWTPDFGKVLVHTSGNRDSGTWFMVDLAELKAAPVGIERPAIGADLVGPISRIEYTAADGLEMDGILTLPPGKEAKNLPVLMLPHGGPTSENDVEFDWWAQAFASRGYAVFQPNFRGSTNRSAAFIQAGEGEWGRKMQSDISDGLAHLAAAGIVDPDRACIMGGSYGGYAALAGVTLQQGIYRCAIAVAPISDLRRMYNTEFKESGGSKIVWNSLSRQLGPRANLEEISPIKFAKRADVPILLLHGRDDTVVPFEQSKNMADALKKAGKPHRLVDLGNEDHWLSRPETRTKMLEEALDFLVRNNPPDQSE